MRRWPRVVAPVQQCCAGRKILLLPDVLFKWIRTRGRWPDDHEEDTCFVHYLQHISHWHRVGESCTCTIAADNHTSALCLPGLLLHEKQKLKVWKCWLFPKPSNCQTFKLSRPLCLATPWKGAQIDCERSLIRNSLPLFSSRQHSQLRFTTELCLFL